MDKDDQEVLDNLEESEEREEQEEMQDVVDYHEVIRPGPPDPAVSGSPSGPEQSEPAYTAEEEGEPVQSCQDCNLLDRATRSLFQGHQDPDPRAQWTRCIECRVQNCRGCPEAKVAKVPRCRECNGNICWCEDTRQPTFFPSDEEFYDELSKESCVGVSGVDEDPALWSRSDGGEVWTSSGQGQQDTGAAAEEPALLTSSDGGEV